MLDVGQEARTIIKKTDIMTNIKMNCTSTAGTTENNIKNEMEEHDKLYREYKADKLNTYGK